MKFVVPLAAEMNCEPRKLIPNVGLVTLVVKLLAVPVPTTSGVELPLPPPVNPVQT